MNKYESIVGLGECCGMMPIPKLYEMYGLSEIVNTFCQIWHPLGRHDDQLYALALACYASKEADARGTEDLETCLVKKTFNSMKALINVGKLDNERCNLSNILMEDS